MSNTTLTEQKPIELLFSGKGGAPNSKWPLFALRSHLSWLLSLHVVWLCTQFSTWGLNANTEAHLSPIRSLSHPPPGQKIALSLSATAGATGQTRTRWNWWGSLALRAVGWSVEVRSTDIESQLMLVCSESQLLAYGLWTTYTMLEINALCL